jgi:4-hydroxyphenylpyruvate dioxygenase-like putative hemolysin
MTISSGRIIAIDHVQLAMPAGAEDVARAFYDGVLGLSELPAHPALEVQGLAELVERMPVASSGDIG